MALCHPDFGKKIARNSGILLLDTTDLNSIIYNFVDNLYFIYFKTHIRNKAIIMEEEKNSLRSHVLVYLVTYP